MVESENKNIYEEIISNLQDLKKALDKPNLTIIILNKLHRNSREMKLNNSISHKLFLAFVCIISFDYFTFKKNRNIHESQCMTQYIIDDLSSNFDIKLKLSYKERKSREDLKVLQASEIINYMSMYIRKKFKNSFHGDFFIIVSQLLRNLTIKDEAKIHSVVFDMVLYTIIRNSFYAKTSQSLVKRSLQDFKNPNCSLINEFIPKPPYLNNRLNKENLTNTRKFTLVLDMDETLGHSFTGENGNCFFKRPYLDEFLQRITPLYEVGIFTSSSKEYADEILDSINPNQKIFEFRLYRNHTYQTSQGSVKDLSKLGRDLKNIILVDNFTGNFSFQKDNGLLIKTWETDINDEQLIGLSVLLESIIDLDPLDIRKVIRSIKQDTTYNTIETSTNPYLKFDLETLKQIISKHSDNKDYFEEEIV